MNDELAEFQRLPGECATVAEIVARYGAPIEVIASDHLDSGWSRQLRFDVGWRELELVMIEFNDGTLEYLAEPKRRD